MDLDPLRERRGYRSSTRSEIITGGYPGGMRLNEQRLSEAMAANRGLEAELRSQSQGLATYEAEFDHLAELNGPLADKVIQQRVPEPA